MGQVSCDPRDAAAQDEQVGLASDLLASDQHIVRAVERHEP